ncbi:MAG: hypothetical protein E6Q97_20775 [Desulfurellales bacterium]|nr:MAG: hypothetical protein E6Q97_20775 [Desulfurellales bacterium]
MDEAAGNSVENVLQSIDGSRWWSIECVGLINGTHTMEAKMEIRILVPLKDVPENAIVTKKTGRKPYTVRRKMALYSKAEGVSNHEFYCRDGCAILLDQETGNGSIYPDSMEVIWNTTLDSLQEIEAMKDSK